MKNATKKRSSKETKSLYAHIIANLDGIEKDAVRDEEEKKAAKAAAKMNRVEKRAAKVARKLAEEKELEEIVASWGLF